jgi:hypothetical protein
MSSESSDPERYSISEMMDRLKERSSNNPSPGELVTRADGSQAIKVRKRKRRSDQPERDVQKQSRRLRALQLSALLVGVVVLLLVCGGALFYYNGSPFRNKVLERISVSSGATAEVSQFRVTPIGVNAADLSLKWPEHSVLKSLYLKGVSAELQATSFLGQYWSGDEITALSGELLIDQPAEGGGPLLGEGLDTHFRFTRFRSPSMSVIVGSRASPAMSISETEISFYPQTLNARPEMRITKGTVAFRNGLPPLKIDRGFFGFTGRQVDVVSLRVEDPSDPLAVIELSGPLGPFTANKVSTLNIGKVEDFPLEHLTGLDLGNILTGRIESRERPNSNFLSFSSGSMDSRRVVLAFRGGFSSQLTLSNLPFLGELARMLDDKGYEQPVIDSGASGILRLSGTGCSIEDLRLEAKSRMIVRGSLAVSSSKALSGHLEIGIPTKQVSKLLRGLDSSFSPPREEMRWIEIEVSGTTLSPADDFEKQVKASISPAHPDPSAPPSTPRSLFEDATRAR